MFGIVPLGVCFPEQTRKQKNVNYVKRQPGQTSMLEIRIFDEPG